MTAKSAYRSGQCLTDERTGEIHDYRNRDGVAHSGVLLPEKAPPHMRDPSQLWNIAEQADSRKNSVVGRELVLSLPSDIGHDERVRLAETMAQYLVRRHGVATQLDLHFPDREGDQRNHHAHILFSTRRLGVDGFGEKTRELDQRGSGEIERIRKAAALLTNMSLAKNGIEQRVDHRSFERRGIDREATQHLGPQAMQMERRGVETDIGNKNRDVQARNMERAGLQREAQIIDLALERDMREHRPESQRVKDERQNFEEWANRKRAAQQSYRHDEQGQLGARQQREKVALDRELDKLYGSDRERDQAKLDDIKVRQERREGWRGLLYRATGGAGRDERKSDRLSSNLDSIAQREREQRDGLSVKHGSQFEAFKAQQEDQSQKLEDRISTAQQKREESGWKWLGRSQEKFRSNDRGSDKLQGINGRSIGVMRK